MYSLNNYKIDFKDRNERQVVLLSSFMIEGLFLHIRQKSSQSGKCSTYKQISKISNHKKCIRKTNISLLSHILCIRNQSLIKSGLSMPVTIFFTVRKYFTRL